MPTRPIIIAEGNSEDVFLLKRAFSKIGIPNPLEVVSDGEEVITHLRQSISKQNSKLPRLLVLDLKMPRLNGFDVLKWLRQQPGLKRLPVVILTSSDEEKDVNAAYDLGANSYLLKTASMEGLHSTIQKLYSYWLETNIQPNCRPAEAA